MIPTSTPDDAAEEVAEPERVTPTATRRWEIFALLAAPVVVLLVLRASPYFRLNNGDPFIYVGYSRAFTTHIERFGYTYHAVRFGLILPLRLSYVFGPVWGYFVLRYLLYLIMTVPLWLVLRPYGRALSIAGPLLLIANPVVAQAVLGTYTDMIVVPALTFVTCLVILACRQDSTRGFVVCGLLAGVSAGMSINANIVSAPVLVLMTLCGCGAVAWRGQLIRGLVLGAAVLVGTVIVSLLGMVLYWRLFGDWNIYRVTFQAADSLSADQTWKTPGIVWMGTRRFIYVPLVVIAYSAAVLIRARKVGRLSVEQWFAFGAVVVPTAFFIAHRFLLDGYMLETSYYHSYLAGPVMILFALGIAWTPAPNRPPALMLLAAPVVLAYAAQRVDIPWFVAYLPLIIVLTALGTATKRWALFAVLLAAHLSWAATPRVVDPIEGAGFQYEPHYEDTFGEVDATGFEAYRLAAALPTVVPSNAENPVPLLFWYRTLDAQLDSIQASYHWQFTTVQRGSAPGLPTISDGDVDRVRSIVGGFVVMIAYDRVDIDAGRRELEAQGFVLGQQRDLNVLTAGDTTVVVEPVPVLAGP